MEHKPASLPAQAEQKYTSCIIAMKIASTVLIYYNMCMYVCVYIYICTYIYSDLFAYLRTCFIHFLLIKMT